MLRILLIALISFLSVTRSVAQIDPGVLKEWEGRKYSMFIHWGIYSELGGVWNGKPVTYGLSEQIQAHAGIYSDTYAEGTKRFNPVRWNADSIVALAKNAGMRSIVFTSKHHDGFCMYHSKYTDFNVVDATPYKRDVLKELSDACARQKMKFGLYYSNIDWHYPQAAPISSHNSDLITPEHFEFNKNQIKELLTHYGPVSELWFDMGSYSFDQSQEMRTLVHQLQPDCMIGSRLGNDMGDFMIMGDNQEPDYIIGAPWQSPASFFHETWGYRSWQERGNEAGKTREKLTSLIRVCSRGGNFLLNIGPRGDGSVVEYERDVLLNIGAWLKKNGEAVYNTQADPYHIPFEWGCITSGSGKLYLHILSKPAQGKIVLPGLKGEISGVKFLSEPVTCSFQTGKEGVTILLPESFDPSQEIKVVEVVFKNGFTVPPVNIIPLTATKTVLNQHNAFKYYSNSGIDYNSRFQSVIKEGWTLQASGNEKVTPFLYYSDEEKGKSIDLRFGESTQTIVLDQGESIPLKSNASGLLWGPMYLQGPVRSGLDGLPGGGKEIDISQPWGRDHTPWKQTDWQNDSVYYQPGDLTQACYILQEITSPDNRQILISVTSGDGILLALNGQMKLLHNNPYKKESMKDVVLLDLKKGKNQLLVKFFNNFRKDIPVSIGRNVPQQIYKQALPAVQMKKGQYYPVSWQLSNPVTPHETINLPNLALKFK